MIKPLNNMVLVEVIDEYAGLTRSDENEQMQKGLLLDCCMTADHLTESTGYHIEDIKQWADWLKQLLGKVVYWQQYADTGRVFEQDGKKYALIPWYRLIGFEE